MRNTRRRIARASLASCAVIGAGALSGSLLGFLGPWWWVLDLFANFRVQYLVLGLAATLGCIVGRSWLIAAVVSIPVFLNLALIIPLYVGGPATGDAALSVLLWNVNHNNERSAEIVAHIAESDADLVAVLELTHELSEAIRLAFPKYRWLASPRADAFGIGVLTRLPLRSHQVLELGDDVVPSYELLIETADGPISVLAVHTLPPVTRAYAASRDHMMAAISEWANKAVGPTVVVGDLNATSWSTAFRTLINDSRLRDSQRGFGLTATWPRRLFPLSISIDHLLHSQELAPRVRRTGPFLGSDHRSLYVELVAR